MSYIAMYNLWVSPWYKVINTEIVIAVLRSRRRWRLLKTKSDLRPKPERFSTPLTRKLTKVSMRPTCCDNFPRKTENKNSVHAGRCNTWGSIRRERWQNETLCTFQPWNYRLVSPRQSPGVTDAIRACLDKRGSVHQHSHLSITAQVCEMIASTDAYRM